MVDVRALSTDISTIVFVPVSLAFVCVGACDFIFVMMKLAHAPPRILPPESWQCYYYQSVLELISSEKLVHEPHIAWKRTVFVCTRRTKLGKPHRTANQVYTHTHKRTQYSQSSLQPWPESKDAQSWYEYVISISEPNNFLLIRIWSENGKWSTAVKHPLLFALINHWR